LFYDIDVHGGVAYMYRPAIIKHNSRNQGNFCPELVTL